MKLATVIQESPVRALKCRSFAPENNVLSLFLLEALTAGLASLLYGPCSGSDATKLKSGIAKLRYRSSDSGLAQVSVLTLSRYR